MKGRRTTDVPFAYTMNGPASFLLAIERLSRRKPGLSEIRFGASYFQGLGLIRLVGRGECDANFREHEVAMRRAARATAWQGVIGERLQPYSGDFWQIALKTERVSIL